MSSTESFDELQQKIVERIEEALSEIREEFLERLQATRNQLDEVVHSELTAAREEAATAATSAVEAEEARAALLAEAEEARISAIAEALAAKEGEFAEVLSARVAAIAEAEQARDTALTEAEDASATLLAEAEEAKSAAIAEALEAQGRDFSETLAAKEAAFAELEEAKAAALFATGEEKEAALAEARSAAEEATKRAVGAALLQLHEVVAKIDAAQSQTEILEALLAGSAGYASRSLLFLTREDGLQGWGGQGFDTEEGRVQETHLDYSAGSAWAELSNGRGTVEMSGEDCGELCRGVDGSTPQDGILIPLVLRDRLAAALYADRLAGHSPFQLATLQIMAYVAGQALESLPMRLRPVTATLRLATETPVEESGLELWQFLAPEEPAEEFASEVIEAPILVPAEPEELAAEEALVEPPAPIEETPEPEAPQWQETAEEAGFEIEEAVEAEEEMVAEESAFEEPVAEVMGDEAVQVEEDLLEDVAPHPERHPVAEIEPPVQVAPPADVAMPTEVTPSTQDAPPTAGAEVAPPEDVDGPGWAFTTRRFTSEGDEDASREEARRLARLLVTEIKLYNEEQVEEGRRGRNIYRALREDIDRSRQIYEERVDEAIRLDTDYFREELVKILAAGDDEVMGM